MTAPLFLLIRPRTDRFRVRSSGPAILVAMQTIPIVLGHPHTIYTVATSALTTHTEIAVMSLIEKSEFKPEYPGCMMGRHRIGTYKQARMRQLFHLDPNETHSEEDVPSPPRRIGDAAEMLQTSFADHDTVRQQVVEPGRNSWTPPPSLPNCR